MIRVYVPTTLAGLARAQKYGTLNASLADGGTADPGTADPGTADDGAAALPAHAVTGAVREWYVDGNLEELEYSVLIEAAEASLWLLSAEPQASRRRVVAAVDVPESVVTPGGKFRSSVSVAGLVKLSRVASVHFDEEESEPVIAAAIEALPAAAEGDDDARFLLDEAEACDLLWYDVTEIDDLIGGR
jgi:hypothetical protein